MSLSINISVFPIYDTNITILQILNHENLQLSVFTVTTTMTLPFSFPVGVILKTHSDNNSTVCAVLINKTTLLLLLNELQRTVLYNEYNVFSIYNITNVLLSKY